MLLMETRASCQLLISSAIETTAIAATSWTLLARTGYIDVDGHAIKFSAIQMVDSSWPCSSLGISTKPKPRERPLTVSNDTG